MGRKLPGGVSTSKHRSGKETLRISFTYRGVNCRESLGIIVTDKNIKFAQNQLVEINNRILRQTFNFAEFFPDSKTRAAKLFGHIRSNIAIGQLFDDANWEDLTPKLTTAYTYKKDSKWAHEYFNDYLVTELTVKNIRDWVKTMKHLAQKTISNRLIPLRTILAMAVDDEIIMVNPCDSVSLGEQSKGLISREQRAKEDSADPFDLDEIEKILESAGQFHEKALNYYQVAFFTGMRHSELAGLKWANVDFVNRTIEVNEALVSAGGKAHKQTPKTRAGYRTIELVPKAMEALKRQQAQTRFAKDHVFTQFEDACDLPITHNDHYWQPWQKIITAAGVRYRPPKQTRHSFASNLLTLGALPAFIADQLGHTDTSMVMRVYGKYIKKTTVSHHTTAFGQ